RLTLLGATIIPTTQPITMATMNMPTKASKVTNAPNAPCLKEVDRREHGPEEEHQRSKAVTQGAFPSARVRRNPKRDKKREREADDKLPAAGQLNIPIVSAGNIPKTSKEEPEVPGFAKHPGKLPHHMRNMPSMTNLQRPRPMG